MQVKYKIDGEYALYETSIKKMVNSDDSVNVRLSMTIFNELYEAESTESTECAVISLQNTLPPNIAIVCCQSCIHGNFCAVGNNDDEIFCTSDFEPQIVDDIFFATEDEQQRRIRSRHLLYVCETYKEITEEKFSYNSWKDLAR
jgi:hypothetical protein